QGDLRPIVKAESLVVFHGITAHQGEVQPLYLAQRFQIYPYQGLLLGLHHLGRRGRQGRGFGRLSRLPLFPLFFLPSRLLPWGYGGVLLPRRGAGRRRRLWDGRLGGLWSRRSLAAAEYPPGTGRTGPQRQRDDERKA